MNRSVGVGPVPPPATLPGSSCTTLKPRVTAIECWLATSVTTALLVVAASVGLMDSSSLRLFSTAGFWLASMRLIVCALPFSPGAAAGARPAPSSAAAIAWMMRVLILIIPRHAASAHHRHPALLFRGLHPDG